MRKKLESKTGKSIYKLRKEVVEPVFGNIKHNIGFRRFLLRGKEKVKGEFGLILIVHNILKITRFIKKKMVESANNRTNTGLLNLELYYIK